MNQTIKLLTLCCLYITLSFSLETPNLSDKIEHVVVVMMENRAFDHMLGYLKAELPEIDGLDGTQFNHVNPFNENSAKTFVSPDAPYVNDNYGHSFQSTELEIFGRKNHSDLPAAMNGFIAAAGSFKHPERVMQSFNPKSLPTLNTLAKEFAVFDRWYASHPGPTEVNRYFMHCATSHGLANNNLNEEIIGMPMRSIFQNLQDAGKTWRVYMEEISTTLFLSQMRSFKYLQNYRFFNSFLKDAAAGELPNYSFIEPRYNEVLDQPANDQHPDHNVVYGEMFIRDIYEAVRASPQWEKTALIITYDEHGGFYDHHPTPTTGVPNPDGINAEDPFFDFKRIGVRIPTVIVSPWIPKSTVVHEPSAPTPDSQFDHTSTLSFVKRLFNLPSFLTKRDAWAGHFDHIFSLNETRTDCPTTVPVPPEPKNYQNSHKAPINDLQWYMIKGLSEIAEHDFTEVQNKLITEEHAADYILNTITSYLPHLNSDTQ
eukprot:TRINITY_DN2655_c0_g2_i1.p1 TRINITY_DN2655_c0_g2~~TRINITY_DN2655_c0_g2_i1.p1  ORF type:complete len:485 (-),score=102.01 TRINITY_DN2655_c0_g2_i1:1027-2481(-)